MKEYRLPIIITVIAILFLVGYAYFRSVNQIQGKPYHHLSRNYFRNPEDNDPGRPKLSDMLRFLVRLPVTLAKTPKLPADMRLNEAAAIKGFNDFKTHDTLTWLGHATFLIRLDGKTILTDPYLTDHAGPWIFGPTRYTPPGIQIKNLPKIDMILLTHNHYDSLDLDTISKLANKTDIDVVVPLYNSSYFEKAGYSAIYELDWFQSIQLNHIKITAIPAIHYSGRHFFYQNKRLWAGYIIQSKNHKILYMCDSAYGEIYRYIGKKYGPFDAVIIDIGAYDPQSVMHFSHTTPEESIKIARELKAKNVIAMHWGTVTLSEEPPLEPPTRFRAAGLKAGYRKDQVWVMKIGETREISN
jgi:N-acyl-phosphatidylethanolamine-hydrolysing phospholipase D